MIRWVCPSCGSGVNAPERPRKKDIRRYCLDCSKAAGVLVERTAPKLERQREAALTRNRAKDAKRRAKVRIQEQKIVTLKDANGKVRELRVRAELQRALRDCGSRRSVDDVDITVRAPREPTTGGFVLSKGYHSGHAWGGYRTAFTFAWFTGAYEEALVTIYHEAGHLASGCSEGHGEKFHRRLAGALQKRWPFLVYGSVKPNQPGGCWAMGMRVRGQLCEHTRNGGEV